MSFKRVETLGDVARFNLRVEVICGNAACGRRRVVFAGELIRALGADMRLRLVGRRLRCQGRDLEGGGCGHRGAIVRFVDPEPPTPPDGGGNVVDLTARIFRDGMAVEPGRRRRRAAR